MRDLLDLAKLDARQFSFDLRRVDLAEVVADTGEGFRPAADDLGLDLSVDAGPLGQPSPSPPTPTAWPSWSPTWWRTPSSTPAASRCTSARR